MLVVCYVETIITDVFILGMQMLQRQCNMNQPISHFKLIQYFVILPSSFNQRTQTTTLYITCIQTVTTILYTVHFLLLKTIFFSNLK